ncbi:alpha/beta hydrolase [Vibrio mediterranei]|uniref:Alpha/beta fold hydrolase n=1 Tax=Vibrio mediterranei TaxID=689 RepID=A0A3G4VDB7_9VIBR|nr:alpha/beta fold hydrolase [Vibrio mediterranei]AYV22747.1 alpha/beta fold hydrolase [Vibrio mediterranei]
MSANLYKLLLLSVVFSLAGCISGSSTSLSQSQDYYDYIQPSFSDYLMVTEKWLAENRSYISDDHDKEITMNMPFELTPKHKTNKAVLLVHGLGDSPYSFSDIAPSLRVQGFHVEVLLLPGHGSKPSDLMLPSYNDWQTIVDHYAGLLKQQYEEVWLGGFSTGGNLVTIHAIENGGIDGLLLFSPGFQSQTPYLEKLAPIASIFFDGYTTDEDNFARYNSAPLNGAIAYSQSAAKLRELLKENQVEIPTLIVLSEADSIIDPEAVNALYKQRFTHPSNQLLWYGESNIGQETVTVSSMKLDGLRISTASHMSPLFAPSNAYYGQDATYTMCMNSMDSDAVAYCEKGGEVWLSAWGYEEEGKVHARLTWNPYYQSLEKAMLEIASAQY